LKSDIDLVGKSDLVVSIVPPRDAVATAQRVIDALGSPPGARKPGHSLYYVDMNAIAPSTCKEIAALFDKYSEKVKFIDSGIIGGPPAPKPTEADKDNWKLPIIPTSGPTSLDDIPTFGAQLSKALDAKHIAPTIGAASGLKMCFASMTKGYTAIAIQAYATAHKLGVLDELRSAVGQMDPARLARTDNGLVDMAPKAYRWVREMEEISKTYVEESGFEPFLFQGVAGVYKAVADDTDLGSEKIGKRSRGKSAEDVASVMAEGLERKRKKTA
jgi:3-hydroxyisobutyrate dehydrogenase-like beta-hydroxyacid dehydrogenase